MSYGNFFAGAALRRSIIKLAVLVAWPTAGLLCAACAGAEGLPTSTKEASAPSSSVETPTSTSPTPTTVTTQSATTGVLQTYPLAVPTNAYLIVDNSSMASYTAGTALSITATPGEYSSASFVISSLSQALSNVTIEASALSGPSGDQIPSSSIDIRLVKTWYQPSNGVCTCDIGKYLIPELLVHDDALIKNETSGETSYLRATVGGVQEYVDITTPGSAIPKGATVEDASTLQPFSLSAKTNKQVWLTVEIPTSVAAGTYKGTITVTADGSSAARLSFTITVLPFTLSPSMIEQAIYYRGYITSSCPSGYSTLNSDCKTTTQMNADLADMLSHGVRYPTFHERYGSSELPTHLSMMKTLGYPTDHLYEMGDNFVSDSMTSHAFWTSTVEKWQSVAKANGFGQVYTFAYDEATGSLFTSELPYLGVVHAAGGKTIQAVPYLTTATTSGIQDLDVVILYGGSGGGFTASNVAQAHETSSKVFMYGNPFSNLQNSQFVRNHYGFGLLYLGYDGELEYTYQDGGRGSGEQDAWNGFVTTNQSAGQHMWTYPASNGPVGTLMWEGYREGVNDIRYASTLAARKGWTKAQLQTYLQSLSTLKPNPSGNNAASARQQIINAILAD